VRILRSLFTLALIAAASPAYAEETVARSLFKEARQLAAKGDYAAACPKFEQSLKLEQGLGTQFNLADCWEHQGRLASARALFLEAADAATAAGQTDREQVLRQRAEALNLRVSKLLVETRPTSAKLTVLRDDQELPAETWGKPQPIDAGSYTIVAKAKGRRTWRKTVEVTDGGSVVSVMVPDLMASKDEASPAAAAPAAEPRPKPAAPKSAEASPPPAASKSAPVSFTPAAPTSDRSPQLSYTVLGLGGVGIGALTFSAVMAFRYSSANGDAESICPTSRDCSSREIADHDRLVKRASTARSLAFVGAGVGVASLGGAAAVYLLQQRRGSSQASLSAAPVVGADGSLGAGLSGSF
jgi:hypothetical protein